MSISVLLKRQQFAILILTILLCCSKFSNGQFAPEYNQADSVYLNTHSPNKATFYSAVLPGLGQIYNKKYWKVPIIYAGFGGLIYYANYNNYVYNKYKDAYNIKLRIQNGETELEDPFPTASAANVQGAKDQWKRWRDLTLIGIGILYVAQIIDADVDANLFDYDMSENLSMRIEPVLLEKNIPINHSHSQTAMGLKWSIKF